MKKLRFRYTLGLELDQPVRDHHFRICCRPMENGRQRIGEFSARIEPADSLKLARDGFGNQAYVGAVMEPHDRLSVSAEGVVFVDTAGETEAFHPMYRFPTACTMPDEGIRRFFGEIREEAAGRPPAEQCQWMMDRLYRRFVYVPGVTTVKTTAAEAFARGQGVCQDYAHIYISLCRLAGYPARYVAGMMLGEGETHAWAEVWLEDGWTGFDPANGRMTDETYIKFCHGRDFADGAMDRGCFVGFAGQRQEISVKVEESV